MFKFEFKYIINQKSKLYILVYLTFVRSKIILRKFINI